MRILSRTEKIKMFLYEYYFGHGILLSFSRILMGPILMVIGIRIYENAGSKFEIAYGGGAFVYSIYYMLIPYLWILFRPQLFKSSEIELDVLPEKLIIKDSTSHTEALWTTFKNIRKRKFYYSFQVSKVQKLNIPFDYFSKEQASLIEAKVK